MIIEIAEVELEKLLGIDVKLHRYGLINLNGETYILVGYDYWSDWNPAPGYQVTYKLHLQPIVKPKSPQEIAAEDAVQKAESALKAAKKVLKTVKEK